MFEKKFNNFDEALRGLIASSHSAAQALSPTRGWGDTQEEITEMSDRGLEGTVAHLAMARKEHREGSQPGSILLRARLGSGVYGSSPEKDSGSAVFYRTSGGLNLGIRAEWLGVRIFLHHPGAKCPRVKGKSSLQISCIEQGFQESKDEEFTLFVNLPS